MENLLYITSSLFGEQGQSSQLSRAFVDTLSVAHPNLTVTHRDLSAEPVPHLDYTGFSAFTAAEAERNETQRAVVALSDALIDEWRNAERVVIALPLYNLGVPSAFKAYIDHIARAGQTFRYTKNGPLGLLEDRKVYVVATRGGAYAGGPMDTQSDFIRHILGLMGIKDIEFIYAEGLNTGEESATRALADAREQLQNKAA